MRAFLKYSPYLILLFALILLYGELKHLRMEQLLATLQTYSWKQFAAALLLVLVNFIAWALYEFVAARQLTVKLPFKRMALTSAVVFPVTNLVGYSLVTGLAIRLKHYAPYGLSVGQVTQLILFNVESWWVGFLFVCGVALVHAPVVGELFKLEPIGTRFGGIVLLLLIAAYLFGCWRAKGRMVRLWRMQIRLPDLMSGTMKVLVSALDNLIVTLTLYVVLPPTHGIPFASFAAFYLAAQLVAIISFVPAGLGVLEAVLLLLLRPYASDADILTSLVLFRLVHFALPFFIAMVIELFNKSPYAKSSHPIVK